MVLFPMSTLVLEPVYIACGLFKNWFMIGARPAVFGGGAHVPVPRPVQHADGTPAAVQFALPRLEVGGPGRFEVRAKSPAETGITLAGFVVGGLAALPWHV